ncbi:MAG: hypothetical protein ACOYUZ_04665 [Patescibacteria group bacterium]
MPVEKDPKRHTSFYPDELTADGSRRLSDTPPNEQPSVQDDAGRFTDPPNTNPGLAPAANPAPGQSPGSIKHVPSEHPTLHFILPEKQRLDEVMSRQVQIATARRGHGHMQTFLGLGESKPSQPPATNLAQSVNAWVERKSDRPGSGDYVMRLAKNAFLRTRNFLDDVYDRTPDEKKSGLEKCMDNTLIPNNLPDSSIVRSFEYFVRSYGYYGPVLWFIPADVTFAILHDAELITDALWKQEGNFIEGYPSQYPFDPPSGTPSIPPSGYWVLAFPGIMPGSACRSFADQEDMLPYLAQTVGLKVKGGLIRSGHHMAVKIPNIVDLLVFYAIVKHSKALVAKTQLIIRSAVGIKAYREENIGGGKGIEIPKHGLFTKYRASALIDPDRTLEVTESTDDLISQGHGITPFFISHIYV